MNIFAIHNNFTPSACNKSLSPTFISNTPVVYELPDTALLLKHRPFFIPDYAQPCSYQGSLVIRISRLGRYIAPQYAHRYFDTATVGIAFTADNLYEHCLSNHLPWDISKGFDGAAAVGQFQPVADLNLPCASFMLKDNGQVVQQSSNENANFSLAEIVSHVSQFFMLRQGDLIYYGFPCPPTKAEIDHSIEGYLNGKRVLQFSIK